MKNSIYCFERSVHFFFRYQGEDPSVVEQKKRTRSLNITIVYPPTLVGEYSLRLSEWTPIVNLTHSSTPSIQQKQSSDFEFCPICRMKGPDDPFGCKVRPNA